MQIEDAHDLSDNNDADETLFAHQIGSLVMKLPSELSQTLLLVAKEGFTYKVAAQAMDIPVGTVMSRIHRARKIISETLTPREEII